jgi:phage shock protein C
MGAEYSSPPPPSSSPPPSPPPAYPPYAPPPPRRLTRSRRERMWAGVAGGMAEYFDLDPALVRLMWVGATFVTGGLAIPVYILAWIILPRDERTPGTTSSAWRDWSQEFHSETQRLAEEARRIAQDVRQPHEGVGPEAPPSPTSAEEPWWQSERYVERRHHQRHPRSTGIVLVALGVLLLAANAGVFSWIDWRHIWPLIFIGLGVILLARQSGWGR